MGERRHGVVSTFDEHRGYGTVRTDDGRDLFFHCTAIADGSRTIEEAVAVSFHVVAGRLGRWEATAIEMEVIASADGRG
ncbi:MAG TPA: cold shock domain-containing protein [Acidimicrobiales bacterium]|nr:cold shock domain-containing protein [Acidimicrobiales bacterium]